MDWKNRFATRTTLTKRSTVREILKLTAQPDVISFAGGLPAPEFFPTARVQQAADVVIHERGAEALQYSTTEGMPELRQLIADRLGFEVSIENILITTGSQQGLDLTARVLIDEGDSIVVENPTYVGMLMALRAYNLDYVPVPTDSDGAIIDVLEPLLQQNPKLVYVVPNFQNPAGTTLSLSRRRQLIELLAKYNIPLVEDNPYGELRYSGESLPSLLELDAARSGGIENGHVIYVGTFSKIMTPGLRLGWVVAASPVIDKLVQAKQSVDLHTSTLDQFIAYETAKDGFLENHIPQLCDVYRKRRDVMLAAMERYFPEGVTWSKPEGGLFLMVRMPEYINALELLDEAIRHKVAFVPGADFHVDGSGANTFRVNFSNAQPERIEEGIRRLGALLHEAVAQVR